MIRSYFGDKGYHVYFPYHKDAHNFVEEVKNKKIFFTTVRNTGFTELYVPNVWVKDYKDKLSAIDTKFLPKPWHQKLGICMKFSFQTLHQRSPSFDKDFHANFANDAYLYEDYFYIECTTSRNYIIYFRSESDAMNFKFHHYNMIAP